MRRALAIIFLLSACGPNEAVLSEEAGATLGENASALGGEVAVSFNRDWTVRSSGAFVVGSQVRVTYDSERLPSCRMEQGGQPLWAITGSWRLGGESGTFEAGGLSPSNHTAAPLIPLRKAGELEVWFQVTNRSGCVAYDSAFGHNFRFTVQDAGPTVRFLGGWRVEQTASTVGAKNVVFEYAPERLPSCRQGYNGFATWDILLYYRFDGGAVAYFPTTRVEGMGRVMNPVVLAVPPGAKRLETWFKANDRAGCVEWDSRYGQNYVFDL